MMKSPCVCDTITWHQKYTEGVDLYKKGRICVGGISFVFNSRGYFIYRIYLT